MYKFTCLKCGTQWEAKEKPVDVACPKCFAKGPQFIGFVYVENPSEATSKLTVTGEVDGTTEPDESDT
jgi:predicted  nucleic acid-binding Zn-ribbon protein